MPDLVLALLMKITPNKRATIVATAEVAAELVVKVKEPSLKNTGFLHVKTSLLFSPTCNGCCPELADATDCQDNWVAYETVRDLKDINSPLWYQ